MAEDKRFDIAYTQGTIRGFKIVIDNYTGVQYLCVIEGSGMGLTPLLDENGKPSIVPVGGLSL